MLFPACFFMLFLNDLIKIMSGLWRINFTPAGNRGKLETPQACQGGSSPDRGKVASGTEEQNGQHFIININLCEDTLSRQSF